MKRCCLVTAVVLLIFSNIGHAQVKSTPSFRLGPTVCFGLLHIANNNVGLGGVAGAEKRVSKYFAAEAEVSYTYFTGDKVLYVGGKNKAFAIPVLAGVKYYPLPNIYASLRAGANYFLLNEISSPQTRLVYGVAGGTNFPKKSNLINVQLGYMGFRYAGVQRGYATLAVAIIIN